MTVLGTQVMLETMTTPVLLGSGHTVAFLQAEVSETVGDRSTPIRTHSPPGEAQLCRPRQRATSALPKSLGLGIQRMEASRPSPGPGLSPLARR